MLQSVLAVLYRQIVERAGWGAHAHILSCVTILPPTRQLNTLDTIPF